MYKRCSCIDTKTKTELSLLIFPQSDQLIASFSKLNQECLLPIIDLVRQNDGSLAVITAKDQILNLKTLLDAHRHLDEKDALIILQSAAQGIQHLHERHIRYQRVCPENVVFC